jgi:hypothetical protein
MSLKQTVKGEERERERELYTDINGFKQGYQPRTKLVKDENDNVLADSHNISNRWKNHFSQLLYAYGSNDVGHTEIQLSHYYLIKLRQN